MIALNLIDTKGQFISLSCAKHESHSDAVKSKFLNRYVHFEPTGMMKDISSAHSPHAIRFAWNSDTHTAITMIQMRAPIAEYITSGSEK